jgi:hypothetical protein
MQALGPGQDFRLQELWRAELLTPPDKGKH